MLIYYVTPEKRALYQIKGKNLTIPISRPPRGLFSLFEKKILILGKEDVYFLKKRYPLLPERELKKAISNEVYELFPLKEPSFLYQIGKKGDTFCEVNLFAWEFSLESSLKKEFPFDYLIPEELLFLFEDLTLSILNKGERHLLVLSQGRKFLNSLLIKNPTSQDFLLFLKASGVDDKEVKQVISFGGKETEILSLLPQALKPKLKIRGTFEKEFPSLIANLNLKPFKKKREITLNPESILLSTARVFLMSVIALQLNLLFTSWEYDRAIQDLSKELKRLDEPLKKRIPSSSKELSKIKEDEEKLQALRELKEELEEEKSKGVSDGLILLTEVAKLLPDGSKLNSFSLKEKKLTLSLTAKDFFETLTIFRKSTLCKDLRLTGAPLFDSRNKDYRFSLECELK